MISNAIQLKARIRNLSGGDSTKAQILIRNFVMERFLERVALSGYRNESFFVGDLPWSTVMSGVEQLANKIL